MKNTEAENSLVIGGLYQSGTFTYIVLEKIPDTNTHYAKVAVYSFYSKKKEIWWERTCEFDRHLA